MMDINDEILNKYIDKELMPEEMSQVITAINNSKELKKKYDALLYAHTIFNNMETESPSNDFTKNVMGRIKARRASSHEQKYFLFTVLSVFGVLVLLITGYVFYELFASIQANESSEIISNYSESVGSYLTGLFDKKNLSILGSVLSLIMLVSGYFFYEYQKHSKKNFSH